MRNSQILSAKRGQMNQTDNEIYLKDRLKHTNSSAITARDRTALCQSDTTLNAPQFVTITSPDSASAVPLLVTILKQLLFKGKESGHWG